MSPEELFHAALAKPKPDRSDFLATACAGDEALRRRVEVLVDAHENPGSFLAGRSPVPTVTVDEPPREGPGTLIGPYKLLEQIGEGGMGLVFVAEQERPVRRQVALKVIKPGMDTREVVARFEAERQALALFDHPHIAKVLDAGATSLGRPFFVMELVRGIPVTDYCDQARLGVRDRLRLFVQICQAVQHAHQKGVIHRDLKPSNVLVTEHDGTPVAKVIDFGVAKAVGQRLTDKTLYTRFLRMVGSPLYMSPEQAGLSELDVDTRADIYSLGVILYELLTGTTPFDPDRFRTAEYDEVRRIIREEEPPRPSSRLSTLGQAATTVLVNCGTDPRQLSRLCRGELDWIVMRALEKDRNRRYESAAAFAADVERYLRDEPVQACPPTAGYRLRKFARRNQGPVVAASLLLLTLIGGVGGTIWQAMDAIRERNAKQKALDQAHLLLAEFAFDKGQAMGERGDADLALLWLVRSLKLAPSDAISHQDAIRTSLGAWARHVNQVALILPHDGWVMAVAVAPDGKLVVASSSEDGKIVTVRRWDPATGQPSQALTISSPCGVCSERAAISPKCDRLLLSFIDEPHGTLQMWDLTTGATVWEDPTRDYYATSAFFSPDGKMVLVGYCVGTELTLASAGLAQLFEAEGKKVGPPLGHPRPVFAAAFHPDGKSFVTECGNWADAAERARARFWDLNGRNLRELPHPCMAQSVAFSPDGHWLLTGHPDHNARLWDLATFRELQRFPHEAPVLSVGFSPADGKTLLTGSADGAVRVWDPNGRRFGQPLRHGKEVWPARFSPSGKSILVGVAGANRSRCWDLTSASLNQTGTDQTVAFPLAVSPDRQTILIYDESAHTVRLRDAATGQVVNPPLIHARPLQFEGVSSHPGQRHACSSDRRRAVTLDEKNVLRLWDTQTGRPLAELNPMPEQTAHPSYFAAAFSPDGKHIVTGNFNGGAHVWDSANGQQLRELSTQGLRGPVFNAAFSPDGLVLATVGADSVAHFWNPITWEALGTPLLHSGPVFGLAFSPDSKTVVTCGVDPIVQLWDIATHKPLVRFTGHQGGVNSVAFSPDGRFVLTGSKDQTARLWDAATGKPIGPPMPHPVSVARVAFSPNGKTILTSCDERVTRSWPVPAEVAGTPEELERWAEVITGMALEADGGVRILDASEWEERRHKLRHRVEVRSDP